MKRILSFALALGMALSLAACGGSQTGETEQQRFDAYLETLPPRLMDSNSLDIQYLFEDPAAFGFDDAVLLELPFATREDYVQSDRETEALLKELKAFDAEKLDDASRLTLEVLQDYLQRSLLLGEQFYEQDNSYLGSFIGFQAQLPLLLAEYKIRTQRDLDSFYHLMETSGETFEKYAEMERQRQESQVGMGPTIMKAVIGQCENFAAGDVGFLVDAIAEEIDTADFLSDEEKAAAREKSEALIRGDFVDAYRSLGESLAAIEINSTDLGLAHQPGGKEYYETLLQVRTGVDMTVEEVRDYFESKLEEDIQAFTDQLGLLYRQDPQRTEKFLDTLEVDYGDFTSAEELVDYLRRQCAADYPALDRLNYTVTPVAEAMQDNFSPAAYLQGRIDAPQSEAEIIYINGAFAPDLFTTVAHEGYPGHMYQHSYFKSLGLPTVRYMIDYNGYSEGWATYIEHNSVKYLPTGDAGYAAALESNSRIAEDVIALSDIGIHYDGWDRDQYAAFMNNYFSMDEELLDGQFDLNLETPTNYLQYSLNGRLFQDMHDEAQEALGEQFSETEFHRVLLDTGPAPGSLIQAQVDAWVDGLLPDARPKAA